MPKEKYIKNIRELDKKIVKRTSKLDKLLKIEGKYYNKIAEGKMPTKDEDRLILINQKKISKFVQENVNDKRNRRLNVMKLKGTARKKSKAKRRFQILKKKLFVPFKTPDNKKFSHAVYIPSDKTGKPIILRHGQQGVKGAGNKSDPVSIIRKKKFVARHKKNINKGFRSGAYWSYIVKWGGSSRRKLKAKRRF